LRHYRQERAYIRWGGPGIAYPELRDRDGNVVAHQSPAQRWVAAARESDAFEVALTHLTGAPTWIDLYNAYEALDKNGLAKGVWSATERRRFTQTANAYHRHYKGRFAPPANPMTAEEGRGFVRKVLDAAVREILAV
jgi:hypothetical protein